jgi:phage host-nuclease inhibitor protein Gam
MNGDISREQLRLNIKEKNKGDISREQTRLNTKDKNDSDVSVEQMFNTNDKRQEGL